MKPFLIKKYIFEIRLSTTYYNSILKLKIYNIETVKSESQITLLLSVFLIEVCDR